MPTPSDYLALSGAAYTPGGVPANIQGWTVATDANGNPLFAQDASTGFQATAFTNGAGEYVIAYQGTNASAGASMAIGAAGADLAIAAGTTPAANTEALNFLNTVEEAVGSSPIYLTGHSLGGQEAEFVAYYAQDEIAGGATFGAPGVPNIPGDQGLSSNFVNYLNYNDVIGAFTPADGDHYGSTIMLGNPSTSTLGETIAQEAASFAASGDTALAAVLAVLAPGTALAAHVLGEYQTTLPAYLGSSAVSGNSANVDGIGDILALPSMYGLTLAGTGTGAGYSTPTDSGGNLTANGESLDVGSSPYNLFSALGTTGNGAYAEVITGDSQNISVDSSSVNSIVLGSNNAITLGSNAYNIVFGTGDSESSTGGNIIVAPSSGLSLSGSNDYVTVGSLASVILLGSGMNISAQADSTGSVTLGDSNTSDTIDTSGLSIYQAAGVSGSKITLGSSSDGFTDMTGVPGGGLSVYDASGVSGGKVAFGGSDIAFTDYATGLTVEQSSTSDYQDTLNVSASLTSSFNGNTSTVNLGNGDTLTLDGDGNTTHGADDTLNLTGQYNDIYNTDSQVNVYGGTSDDTDYGSGNTFDYYGDGEGDGDGDGLGDGDGGDGDGDGDGDDSPDLVGAGASTTARRPAVVTAGQVGAASPTGAIAITAAASASSAVFEGPKWRGNTVTFSFATSGGNALSALEQAVIIKAFEAWGQASGLVFRQVGASSTSDISIGFAAAGTLAAGTLGQTTFSASGTSFLAGSVISLAGPDQVALIAGADGQLTYAGTGVELYQLALHEIGSALGLADDNDPGSVMYDGLGSNNVQLDISDTGGIQQLYGTLQSTGNDNTLIFNQGAGELVVNQVVTGAVADNKLAFSAGITPSEITVTADADGDVILTLSGSDQVVLAGELNSTSAASYGVQSVNFSDGTTWGYNDLLAKADTASATNTSLYGDAGANVLDSKGLATYEQGNGGGDTFVYNRGYGPMTILEADTTTPDNTLAFGASIAADQVAVSANAQGDLILSLSGTDQIILAGALESGGGTTYGVQAVSFADGSSLNYAELLAKADTASAANTSLYGDTGANVLDSQGLATYEQGNGGGDTYVFGRGYGALAINNVSSGGQPSGTVQFGSGVEDDQIWLDQSGSNLVVDILGTNDSLTIQNWFAKDPSAEVSSFETGNGETLGSADVSQLVQSMAAFEASYTSSTGSTFNPAAASAGTISDPSVLAAVNTAWHH